MSADATKVRDALDRWGLEVMSGAVDDTPDLMRPLAPIGTPSETSDRAPGQLRESLTVSQPVSGGGSSFRGRVAAPVAQAVYTDQGTVPHEIPTGGAAEMLSRGYPLRFYWARAGAVVYRWSVNHPGNPAQNWWEPAVRQAWTQALLARAVSTPFR